MGTAAATTKRPPSKHTGRPSKLTPEVHAAIVGAIRKGAPVRLAAEACGLSELTVLEWIRRGNGEDTRRPRTEPYAKFAADVAKAKPALDMVALTALNRVVRGQRCKGCDSKGWFDIELDGKMRCIKCPACSGTTWQMKPDGRLAMTVLERRLDEFARRDRVTHDHQVSGSVEISVSVEAARVDMASTLVAMGADQISAMLTDNGGIDGDFIEAEVVPADE